MTNGFVNQSCRGVSTFCQMPWLLEEALVIHATAARTNVTSDSLELAWERATRQSLTVHERLFTPETLIALIASIAARPRTHEWGFVDAIEEFSAVKPQV